MATKIKPLRKFTTGTPTTSDMEEGELAVNTADQKIFMRDNNNAIVEVANASGSAADDITLGDAAVTLATSSGDITIDAQGSDTDIIFKGTDNTTDITPLRLDMSDAGRAKFAANVNILTSTGGTLTLQNSSTAILANNVLGKIEFQAPNESTGGTADDVLGAIEFNATSDITSSTKAFTEFTIKGSTSSSINQEIVTINGSGAIAMKGDLSHSGSGAFSISNANGNLNLASSNNQAKLQGNDVFLNSFTSMQITAQSGDITIDATGGDTDIIFKGTDNTTDITALTLDMSDAGKAIFNSGASFGGSIFIPDSGSGTLNIGAGNDLRLYHNGFNSVIVNDFGSLYLVNETADADIILQADDGTGSANTSGEWTVTISTISDGSHTITAKQTDTSNNVSGLSSG